MTNRRINKISIKRFIICNYWVSNYWSGIKFNFCLPVLFVFLYNLYYFDLSVMIVILWMWKWLTLREYLCREKTICCIFLLCNFFASSTWLLHFWFVFCCKKVLLGIFFNQPKFLFDFFVNSHQQIMIQNEIELF